MKRSELGFNLVSIPLDACMLLLAGVSAFYTRLQYKDFIGPVLYKLDIDDFLLLSAKIVPILIIIFAVFGLYNLRGTRRFSTEFTKIAMAMSVGVAIVVIMFFFDQTVFPSRFIILATGVLAVAYVYIGRVILHFVQRLLFRKGFGVHRMVVVNGSGQAKSLEYEYRDKRLGYEIVAELDYSENLISHLEKLSEARQIDEIMQANPTLSSSVNEKLLSFARERGLQFSFVPNLFEMQRNVVEVESHAGVPVISIKNTPLDGWGRVAKRLVDFFGSLFALILLSPIFLIVWVAVKLDSKGPAIYSALRGGKGKDFKFYKFRSMYAHMSPGLGGEEAEKLRQELWKKNDRGGFEGPFLKIKNDPRVTRVGRLLRKTKLDEIPQFWNVLKGDMSLVGPRAHVLDEVEKYRNHYQRMFSIKPGIFGMSQLAQVNSPDLPFNEEIRLNTFYIENWSLWLDIKILIKIAYLLFFGKKPKEDY